MSITKSLRIDCRASSNYLRGNVEFVASGSRSVNEPIPPGPSVLNVPIDVSALKVLYMVADQDLSIQFEGPDKNFSLVAGEPFTWHNRSHLDNPFGSDDVTAINADNYGDITANLQIEILSDATP